MISIISLWLPIILSAVLVFLLSSVIHMVLPYHKSDFKKLPSEDQLRNDMEKTNIPAGEYMFPFCADSKERSSQEFKDKMDKGPNGIMTIFPKGGFNMGSSLVMWFVYSVVIGIFAAYITGRTLSPGVNYITVFRFVGAVAFIGYSLALMQNSIWYGRSWTTTFKFMFDGLIYALFTGGIFGWLWPAV
jgi:hypothetical protein